MNDNQPTFASMFGGATANVDYTGQPGDHSNFLPMPEPTDDLDTSARKLRELARVVTSGKSLAVATGYQHAAHETRDPEALARMSMTPSELEQFDAWKKGLAMPPFDWSANRKAVPTGAQSQLRFERRAKAMDIIWGHEGATAENASWLTSNMSYAIPLVVAVARMHAAERELRGGQEELTEYELAEVQTTHKVVAIAMDNMNQVYRRLNEIARDINHSKEIIQAREHHIKAKIPKYKKRQDPINRERTFAGLQPIGAGVDFGAATGGKRAGRTDLLAGSGVGGGRAPARVGHADANKRPRLEAGESSRMGAASTRSTRSRGPAAPTEEMEY
ncbi:hypothetical protein [Corynespora cassiicola bipartite mycovirus 1]|nr:hypothetical protein [Corynespora cassiicola bipartite mycovirus 1]